MSNAFVDVISREFPSNPQLGVEVGVSQGKTSAALLKAFPELILVMVDAWAVYPVHHPYRKSGDGHAKLTQDQQDAHRRDAVNATAFAHNRRRVIHGTSLEASWHVGDGQADFVIIDGDHTFEAVAMDSRLWWPKLIAGGLLLWDDLGHPRDCRGLFGVERGATEFAAQKGVELHLDKASQKGWAFKPDG